VVPIKRNAMVSQAREWCLERWLWAEWGPLWRVSLPSPLPTTCEMYGKVMTYHVNIVMWHIMPSVVDLEGRQRWQPNRGLSNKKKREMMKFAGKVVFKLGSSIAIQRSHMQFSEGARSTFHAHHENMFANLTEVREFSERFR
jgi:hypothetical protein